MLPTSWIFIVILRYGDVQLGYIYFAFNKINCKTRWRMTDVRVYEEKLTKFLTWKNCLSWKKYFKWQFKHDFGNQFGIYLNAVLLIQRHWNIFRNLIK